jgi:hypothetical protein
MTQAAQLGMMRSLIVPLALVACVQSETRRAVDSPPAQASGKPVASAVEDTVLVYTGPLPNPDTITARVVPDSAMKGGVTYVGGRPMNFGAFDSLAPRLSLPRIIKGYCESEDCFYPWHPRACRELTLYKADSAGAAIAGRIAAGDTFTVENSNLHILAPLKVVFSKAYAITESYDIDGPHGPRPDTVRFAAGDTLYVFERELFRTWWYHGMLGHGQPFWNSTDEVSQGRTIMWYQVTRADRSQAWWKREGNDVSSFDSSCDSRA